MTLAFRAADVSMGPDASGFLVPPVEARANGWAVKASTYSFAKWDWVRARGGDLLLLRTSLGRAGEEATLQVGDDVLVARSLADLADLAGLRARPVESHVQRWGGALPQYAVGHLDRIARVRAAVAEVPGLAVCGAAYDGVGIPAVIGSARAAAARRAPGWARHNEGMSDTAPTKAAQLKEINDSIRYTMWSVFSLRDLLGDLGDQHRDTEAREVDVLFEKLAADDVVVRGIYDVSGFRADADVMVWWHAATAEQLQDAYNRFRRTVFGRRLDPVWSQLALHRPAEFNKSHVPAFLSDEEGPRAYVCVYPFVRSYDWYLIDESERRAMLAEHGQMARGYPDVRANTVSSFALGDYEWMLAFEADELHRIVDLMRHLRASTARRHVREEVPFYTGPRTTAAELLHRLP